MLLMRSTGWFQPCTVVCVGLASLERYAIGAFRITQLRAVHPCKIFVLQEHLTDPTKVYGGCG